MLMATAVRLYMEGKEIVNGELLLAQEEEKENDNDE